MLFVVTKGGCGINSQEYWQRREEEALKHYISDEKEYDKEIQRIYRTQLDGINKEIEAFYGKYAAKEKITLAEAKKRVKTADIKEFERKAARYVKDASLDRKANGGKTNKQGYYFSEKANEEMRLYNLTMKVNRLELLKANIGLEMVKGHAELESLMGDILQGRTIEELKRQAGILGKTVRNNAQLAHAIPNASFHNANFSDRVWMYHDVMKADLEKLLTTALIQGKNPRQLAKELEKYVMGDAKGGAKFNAERLMRTELARVQTEAQKQSFERNGFDEYEFIANSGCCAHCQALNGKHFKVAKMMPGENAPPMHPFCRCSTAAYSDDAEYEEWLDFLDKGGTTAEFEKKKAKGALLGAILAAPKKANKQPQEIVKVNNSVTNNSNENANIKLSNQEVRKWYIDKVSHIAEGIDSSLPMEEQARQAFEARNAIRTEAREMMLDQDTRKYLDKEYPNKTFEELIESKMKRKGMTREEAIQDIYKTATKTNKEINKELGLEGDE